MGEDANALQTRVLLNHRNKNKVNTLLVAFRPHAIYHQCAVFSKKKSSVLPRRWSSRISKKIHKNLNENEMCLQASKQ